MVKKRNIRKTLENKLDKIFSLLVRKAGFCARCNKVEGIQCSHIHSRTKKSVRWDLKNAIPLCAGCHLYWWHMHPIDAAEFAKNYLGEVEYTSLLHKARTPKTWEIDEMEELYRVLNNEYQGGSNG